MKVTAFILVILLLSAMPVSAAVDAFWYPADSARARIALEQAQAGGYLDACLITGADMIRLIRGKRSVVVSVILNDSVIRSDMREWCTRAYLERLAGEELRKFQAEGHYLARVKIERLDREGTRVIVRLRGVPGPMVRVARLYLEGLQRTNPTMIRRAITAVESNSLTDALVTSLVAQVSTLDYVTLTGPPEIRFRPGYTEADLVLRFRERQQLRFFGGGGYAPDDETGLVWNADLALVNPFGSGRMMNVHSGHPDRGRTALSVDYSQPVFWIGTDRLRLAVATRDYRDDFYEFGVTAGYTTSLTPGFELSLSPGWRRVEPAGLAIGYSAYAIGFAATRDRMAEPANPRSGYRLSSDITYVNRRYSRDSVAVEGSQAVYNETRASLLIESYLPLWSPLGLKTRAAYQGFETGQALPPVAELFLVGGPGSLRGYRTEQFAARQTVQVSLEPHYRFESGYLFAFCDAAYINRPVRRDQDVIAEELYRTSVGLGLGLVWPSQTFTLSFGWGRDAALDQPRLAISFESNL